MSKEEKIKEAYGRFYNEKYVRKDGSMSEMEWKHMGVDLEYDDFSTGYFRPKSLQGIENNNGWISVLSENDLPSEKQLFRFIPVKRFKESFIGWIDNDADEVFFIDFDWYETKENEDDIFFIKANAWLKSQITHYKKIESSDLPPIY
jgi:hypothetical protein